MGSEVNPKVLQKAIVKTIKDNKYVKSLKMALTLSGVNPITYNKYFPKESEGREEVDMLILQNRAKIQLGLLTKWGNAKKSTPITDIALMKMVGSKEDVHRLNGTKSETTIKGKVEIPLFGDFDDKEKED